MSFKVTRRISASISKVTMRQKVVVLVGTATILASAFGLIGYKAMANEFAKNESSYVSSIESADNANKNLACLIERAAITKEETSIDSVSTPVVYYSLDLSLKSAKNLMRKRNVTIEKPYRNIVNSFVGGYDEATSSNTHKADTLNKQCDSLKDAIDAFDKSKHVKDCENARDSLQSRASEAQELYDATEGRVLDSSTREALSGEISDADTIIRDPIDDTTEVAKYATTGLDKAIESVNESNQAYMARAQARARTRQTSSPGSGHDGSSSSSDSGSWDVNYYQDYWTDSASSSGAVTEWAPGYYVAHRHSSNGQTIASRPGTVTVNGRTYRYVSSQNVSTDTTWDQVEGYVHQNNGIGFQTCDGGTYLVTHYEPVD